LHRRAPDVHATLTVIARGSFAPPKPKKGLEAMSILVLPGDHAWLDLHGVDLRRAHLPDAHLERAGLGGAHLEGAGLGGAHLEGAFLGGAHLEGAFLGGVHLEGAFLGGAHLEGADLSGAHLADPLLDPLLAGGGVAGAHLDGAVADEQTSWPAGFDWRAAGVIVRGEDNEASST
jgi:hypothetical protein